MRSLGRGRRLDGSLQSKFEMSRGRAPSSAAHKSVPAFSLETTRRLLSATAASADAALHARSSSRRQQYAARSEIIFGLTAGSAAIGASLTAVRKALSAARAGTPSSEPVGSSNSSCSTAAAHAEEVPAALDGRNNTTFGDAAIGALDTRTCAPERPISLTSWPSISTFGSCAGVKLVPRFLLKAPRKGATRHSSKGFLRSSGVHVSLSLMPSQETKTVVEVIVAAASAWANCKTATQLRPAVLGTSAEKQIGALRDKCPNRPRTERSCPVEL